MKCAPFLCAIFFTPASVSTVAQRIQYLHIGFCMHNGQKWERDATYGYTIRGNVLRKLVTGMPHKHRWRNALARIWNIINGTHLNKQLCAQTRIAREHLKWSVSTTETVRERARQSRMRKYAAVFKARARMFGMSHHKYVYARTARVSLIRECGQLEKRTTAAVTSYAIRVVHA